MNDEPELNISKAIELKKARLAEYEAAIERELAELAELDELARLASKHNFVVNAAGKPARDRFDGTVVDLVRRYRADERSPYRALKHRVRVNYDAVLDRIIADIGRELIADLNAAKIVSLHKEKWAAGGKLAMGHTVIAKLRLLSTFGSTILDDDGSTRLSAILSNLRFKPYGPRSVCMTADHANAIRAKAHEVGLHSLACAQAFQFDLPMLRQSDVIGEWVPASEPGISDIAEGKQKWLRGLRWSEIVENLILRRVLTSGRQNEQKEIEIDLKHAPMVMEELAPLRQHPRAGPVIINEKTGVPFSSWEFRKWWRRIATAAGVPKTVRNTDSRREAPSTAAMPIKTKTAGT
jgi:hypothetical protein